MRIKISIGILAIMVVFGFFSGLFIHKNCSELVSEIAIIEKLVADSDLESSENAARKLEKKWNRFSKTAVLFVRSDKLTETESTISRIIPLIQTNCDELSAELSELKSRILHISDSEKVHIRNIL